MAEQLRQMPTRRQALEILRGQLDTEYASFQTHHRELADYILPHRPRFLLSDTNRGERKNTKIIDSTATYCARTISAGMVGGITSPARPWKRLGTPDPDLNEYGPVKDFLHRLDRRMNWVMARSNLYNSLPIQYLDLPTFATSPLLIEKDPVELFRTKVIPVGSYRIACDRRGRVNLFYRELRMTVRQIVEKFGRKNEDTGAADWSNISDHVRSLWDNANYEHWIDVCHFILPNELYDRRKLDAKYKRVASVYYEKGSAQGLEGTYIKTDDQDKYLRESGFDYFPILAPRWGVTGEDAYGTSCPGMDSLGDIKQSQLGERRIAEAIEKMVRPPMTGPSRLMGQSVPNLLPGGFTGDDSRDGRGFRPAFEVDPRISELKDLQNETRQRIMRTWYTDLFLMMQYSDRRQITAREIEERHEEKLVALGPVLEQLNQDLLNPLIDMVFYFMLEAGMVPEIPDELAGMPLRVEYISIMAQAQKMVGLAGSERFIGAVGNMVEAFPEVADKINIDQWVDDYGDGLGVSPGVIRSDEETAEIRSARIEGMRAQAAAATARDTAGAVKDLSQANTEGDNALAELIRSAKGGGALASGGAAAR